MIIPVKVIKENKDFVTFFIHHSFNNSLSSFTFPTALKYADVKPVLKKDGKTDKKKYRPISILSTLSHVYESLIYNQMYPYFDKLFSKFQCGFRKGFNVQHCLITMIEKWRRSVDGCDQAGALLTDLKFLIGLTIIINSKTLCLRFWWKFLVFYWFIFERTESKNQDYSAFAEILFGVPQGSIVGPLLFNIYICDLSLENSDIDSANYADDNTPYACSSDLDSVIFKLQKNTKNNF